MGTGTTTGQIASGASALLHVAALAALALAFSAPRSR
jgi:hypothetical protein